MIPAVSSSSGAAAAPIAAGGAAPLRLHRKGSWLRGGAGAAWQMLSVHGPLIATDSSRQYFRIETSAREILLVFRTADERGMRELFLCGVERPIAG